ncbi:uncharacterized protein LOC124374064 isoform X1 [Homalodisca vitripennis]|uniref:uncharacterized protein LOC124374064 isoform X1 n=1 Tax=Homalodisca vitripennis TaxID=197043 RepID=UPI001EE9D098|nr:uncharacterized protein LOC124374064 isoform X1 [Homalodisca vitripennis]
MSRRADIILALATNALKSSASKDSETQDEVCHSNNDDSNLRSAEDGVENNKVDGLFEPLEEEEYIESGSDRSLFSSDGQEEYQPDLNDLSSSDEDESFTRKVKIENKEKTRKRKCAFQHNSDEDIIPGTDSDSDRPSYLFQKKARKNNTSTCLNLSIEIAEQCDKSNRDTQSEVIDNQCEEHVIEPHKKRTKIFNLPQKQSRKRLPMPETWKRNKAKLARECGKSYVTHKGLVIKEKIVNEGILCNEKCRFKCNDNFSIEDRKEILTSFYKLDTNSKNNLLFKSIVPVPVDRSKQNVSKKKSQSYQFYVRKNNEDERVCKKALCSLFQIGKKKIELLQEKMKNGISAAPPDKRGFHMSRPHKVPIDVVRYIQEHIKSFPSESSHYSRNVNAYKKYLSPLLNIPNMHKLYIDLCEHENKPECFRVT